MTPRDIAKAGRIAEVGAVYLLRDKFTGLAKIGWARDVERRAKSLQTGHPNPLQVTACVAGSRRVEADIHRLFADRRVRGEWFDDRDGEVSGVFSGLTEQGF